MLTEREKEREREKAREREGEREREMKRDIERPFVVGEVYFFFIFFGPNLTVALHMHVI